MVITDNIEICINMIVQEITAQNRKHKVFTGSEFKDDKSEKYSYAVINEII